MSTLRVNTLATSNGLYTGPVERILRASIYAWVQFDGASVGSGLNGVRGGYNIAGITDQSSGLYVISFSTALPDSGYAAVATSSISSANQTTARNIVVDSHTTTSVRVFSQDDNVVNGGIFDLGIISVIIIR